MLPPQFQTQPGQRYRQQRKGKLLNQAHREKWATNKSIVRYTETGHFLRVHSMKQHFPKDLIFPIYL